MNEERQGPDPDTLRKLAGMMPSFIAGMEQKRARGKGVKVVARKARRICSICARLFDYAETTEEITMGTGHCELCAAKLKEGYAALVCADRFAFVKSERLKDLAGTVEQVSPEVMAEVEKHYVTEWKKEDGAEDKPELS
jgi:hypothetical protein